MTYSREDEHEGRHPLKKGSDQYKRRQQGCATAKVLWQPLDTKSNDHTAGPWALRGSANQAEEAWSVSRTVAHVCDWSYYPL